MKLIRQIVLTVVALTELKSSGAASFVMLAAAN
jgi:hypothetical protein